MTADQLRDAEAAYRAALAVAEGKRLARDAIIGRALKAGWTHARIAGATGLTRGRIGQLATTSKEGTGPT